MADEELKPNPSEAVTQEAQLAAENMAAGKEEAPNIDFDADYAAAQQMSVSDIDRTEAGAQAAEEATAPQFEVSQQQESKTEAPATGNPDDYKQMAQESAAAAEPVSEVSDDLLKKALDLGKAGNS
ncbi:hypothetical protein [Chroogloeocystis siderophila]|jgi:hypothetical protein|uniref:Uncharacterized protein n=1 Tax=Chroogloeocystis siderophila 5.2 s.c.1 TaxID=247279 RepID=A0A1U7HUZ2_9CHRO|nr:hypothetical protein [Chroogloeocystis siderophila]OKH27397.1 hypothetical protein NIES1031_08875 [Chroogloeocystis siderophila 5.2 s.c.1]